VVELNTLTACVEVCKEHMFLTIDWEESIICLLCG